MRALLALAAALLLSACGLQPMYAGGAGGPVAQGLASVEVAPIEGKPGLRSYKAMENAFHDFGFLLRITADTIALSPPLIITQSQIEEIFLDKMPKVLASVANL